MAHLILLASLGPPILGPLLVLTGALLWAIPAARDVAGRIASVGATAFAVFLAAVLVIGLPSTVIGSAVPAIGLPIGVIATAAVVFALLVRSDQVANFLPSLPGPEFLGILTDGRWVDVRRATVKAMGVYVVFMAVVALIEYVQVGRL